MSATESESRQGQAGKEFGLEHVLEPYARPLSVQIQDTAGGVWTWSSGGQAALEIKTRLLMAHGRQLNQGSG